MNLNQANFILRACRSLGLKAHFLNACDEAMDTFGVLMNGPDYETLFLHFSDRSGPFATADLNAPESFRCDMFFTEKPREALFWILFCPPGDDERITNPWDKGGSILVPRHLFPPPSEVALHERR